MRGPAVVEAPAATFDRKFVGGQAHGRSRGEALHIERESCARGGGFHANSSNEMSVPGEPACVRFLSRETQRAEHAGEIMLANASVLNQRSQLFNVCQRHVTRVSHARH